MFDAIIIGAGLAGLSCARQLHQRGMKIVLLEASDGVGGRIRTDLVDGFQLDRGFQVLLDSYPEAREQLDFPALRLHRFLPGALVHVAGRFHEVADPWRSPASLWNTLRAPVGSWRDKLRIAFLKSRATKGTFQDRMQDKETSTAEVLHAIGFSERMIQRFFRPFLGGIFLDASLETSSRMLDFVFRMFAEGNACLPASGMEAIPRQMAAGLPKEVIRLKHRVVAVDHQSVVLEHGEVMPTRAVVVAVDGLAAQTLIPDLQSPSRCQGQGVTCFYYSAKRSPVKKPILVLNGDQDGPINNLCVPTDVASSYGPPGKSLLSVSVLGVSNEISQLEQAVRRQLTGWFGSEVANWQQLKSYVIPFALPSQPVGWLEPCERSVRIRQGLYVCGDHRDQASIQGALVSGRRAAEAVANDLAHVNRSPDFHIAR